MESARLLSLIVSMIIVGSMATGVMLSENMKNTPPTETVDVLIVCPISCRLAKEVAREYNGTVVVLCEQNATLQNILAYRSKRTVFIGHSVYMPGSLAKNVFKMSGTFLVLNETAPDMVLYTPSWIVYARIPNDPRVYVAVHESVFMVRAVELVVIACHREYT